MFPMVGGAASGVNNPESSDLENGEMTRFNTSTGKMEGSDDINSAAEVDFGSKDLRCKSVITESASIELGPAITISERGGYVQYHADTTGKDWILIDFEVGDSGSVAPFYDSRAAKEVRYITQTDDTQVMSNVTSYEITPPNDEDISKVYLKFDNAVDNFRMQVVSQVTGEAIKYFPSENDWRNGTGVSVGVGEFEIVFDSPLAELSSVTITANIMADTPIDLLGDGVNPWRAIDRQIITKQPMLFNGTTDASVLQFVVDEDNLVSDSDTKVPTQQSVKAYIDGKLTTGMSYKGGYNADTNTPNLENQPTGMVTGDVFTVTVAGTFFSTPVEIGDVLIAEIDDPAVEADWTIILRHLDGVEVKTVYESNADTNAFTDSLKTKLENITGNGVADHWSSGLAFVEQSPKDQTVIYTSGTYLISGDSKTVASGGTYDLENGFGGVNHYTGLTASQHRFVTIYVDADEAVKSVGGAAADKGDVPQLPATPIDSIAIAVIEIKVNASVTPRNISNKEITDTRNAPAFNTDEFVKVSPDDTASGHLFDKLSNDGNVTFSIVNAGGIETIKADAAGGSGPTYTELQEDVGTRSAAGFGAIDSATTHTDSIVDVVVINNSNSNKNVGVRSIGSSINRVSSIVKNSALSIRVNTDSNGKFEIDSDSSTDVSFTIIGKV